MHRSEKELQRLTHWALFTLVTWTAVVGYSLHSTSRAELDGAMALARNTARANFFKDQAFRLWASSKGGLYAQVDEHTQPLPFMAHVPDRDLETTDGRQLTLMNPASMLREMMNQYSELYGIRGRIVGIVTLNPANRADAWEEKAIHAFERGTKEVFEVSEVDRRPYLRLIRPMIMQPPCMKCHGHLGFKVGDVRGAVGVSVPLAEYLQPAMALQRQAEATHGLIWLIGLVGGGLFFRGQRLRIKEREDALESLALSARVFDDALHGIAITDPEGVILRINQAFSRLTGYPAKEAVGAKLSLLKSDRHDQAFYAGMWKAMREEGKWQGELWNQRKDGTLIAVSEHNTALLGPDGEIRNFICMFEDITERKRAEDKLRSFQAMAEASGDAIVMADPTTTELVYANRAAHEMFGCDHASQEMLGLPGAEFWHEEDREKLAALLLNALEGGWRGDVRQKRRDGTVFEANATVFSIEAGESGQATLVAIIRDITDKKHTEVQLRTANAKLESIIDFLPDATFVVDWEGRVIAWNRAMETMSGVAKAQILGQGDQCYAAAFYGKRRPMLIDLIMRGDREEATLYRSLTRHGDVLVAEGETPEAYGGRGAYVWATALPLRDPDGRVVGAIECVRDITDSRRAEAALVENEERLRLAMEGTSDGIWDWDFHTGKTYFSPRYYTMLGYEPGAFPANYDSWRNLLHPDDLPGAEETVRNYIEHQGEGFAAEFRCRAKDGSWRWILGRGKVVEWDSEGRPVRMAGSHTDISARKAAEDALRRTQFTVDHASDAIFWYDVDGRFNYVNEAACRMLGYSRQALLNLAILDVDVSIQPEDFRPMMDDLVKSGSIQMESRLRRADGGLIDVAISAMHIYFGSQDQLVAHIRDISDQKKAERSLRREMRFSDSLINSLPGVFYTFDEALRLVRWNRNLSEISGHPEESIGGMAALDLIAEEDRTRVADAIQAILRDGVASVEASLLTANGARIPYLFTGLRMQEGGRTYIIGSGLDISERRRAEETLRLTQFAVDSSSIAFQWVSDEGRIVGCNRQAHESLGLSHEEFIGMRVWEFDPDFPGTGMAAHWAELKRVGRLTFESRHRHKDGHVFPVEITSNFVEFDGHEYAFTYITDISQRKAAEHALLELNATLEARVQEEVAKNRDKDHLLIQQSRLAAMGEMMGNIAHQWRQPINALSLVLANIKDAYEFDQLDEDYLDGQMERGINLIHKMSTTIDDFRNFFRPDRTSQVFSLAKAARDAMMIVELSYAHASIELVFEPGGKVECIGYPNEYAQVVLNLLSNAKDAILERGVAAGRVELRIERDARHGRLVLSDNGGGIDEAILPKVFDPYFTTREKGTGIGLYMSRMIIENMGGRIEVANANGGVRVTLTTPLADAGQQPGPAGAPDQTGARP